MTLLAAALLFAAGAAFAWSAGSFLADGLRDDAIISAALAFAAILVAISLGLAAAMG